MQEEGEEVKIIPDESCKLYQHFINAVVSGTELSEQDRAQMLRVKAIPNEFLVADSAGDERLQKVKNLDHVLSCFPNIEKIGFNFGYNMEALESFDLTPFSNVKVIEASFLSICTSIKVLDLAPLKNLEVFNCGSFLYPTPGERNIQLLNAHVLEHVKLTGRDDCSTWLKTCIAEATIKMKRREVVLIVSLVAQKGKSRISLLFSSEWIPQRLVLKFMLP